MSCGHSVPVGIVGPSGVRIFMHRKFDDDDWNPMDVTGAAIGFVDPDGVSGTWPATFSGATSERVVVDHVFAQHSVPRPLGDINKRGSWRVWAIVTVPGGTRESVPGILSATEAGELVPDC